ncbi:MAG: AI-2E family transporter [Caldilineaceae bacterium]|nr:AI-2E family transporter [Caldilineaceae bacterium]
MTEVPASSRWDRATKRTVVVLLLVVFGLVLWLSLDVLPLVIISALVAYLLSPIVDFCERIYIPRSISTMILFVLLFTSIILLPVFLIPVLLEQLNRLGAFNPTAVSLSVLSWLNTTVDNWPDTFTLLGFHISIADTLDEVRNNFQQYLVMPTIGELLTYIQQVIGTTTTVVSSTAVIGISVVGGIVQFFFTFLITFFLSLYLTKDAPAIRNYAQSLLPPSYQPEFGELLRRVGFIWQAFFRGQIILSLLIGVTTWLALEAAGMPGALILGILAGMLEVVPNLGPTMAMIPAILVALIQGSDVLRPYGIDNVSFALITVAIYFIIQQLENNIVVPRVIGDSVNLHPVVVICGVFVGFSVGNILGAFLAAPLIASLRVVGGYLHAKLLEYPPFPEDRMARQQRRLTYRRVVKGEDLKRNLPRRRPFVSAKQATPPAPTAQPEAERQPAVKEPSQ